MANHILGIILFIAMIFPCLRSWLYNRKKLAYRLFIAFIYANKRSGKLGQMCIYRQVARTNDRCRYDTATTPPLSTRLEMLPKYWVSWIYLLSFSRLWTKNKRLMSHSTRNLLKTKTRCLKVQLKRQPSKTTARNVSDAIFAFSILCCDVAYAVWCLRCLWSGVWMRKSRESCVPNSQHALCLVL